MGVGGKGAASAATDPLASTFDPSLSGIDPTGGILGLDSSLNPIGGGFGSSSSGGGSSGIFGSTPGDISSQGTGLPANLYDQASNLGGQNTASTTTPSDPMGVDNPNSQYNRSLLGLGQGPAPNTPGSAQLQSTPVQTQSFVNDPSGVDNPDSAYNQALNAQSTSPFASGTSPVPFGAQAQTGSVPGSMAAQPYSTGASFPTANAGSMTAPAQPFPPASTAVAGMPAPAPVSTAAAPAATSTAPSPIETATNQAAADVTAQQPSSSQDTTQPGPAGGVNHAQNIQQSLGAMGMPQGVQKLLGDIFSAISGHGNPMAILQDILAMITGQQGGGQRQQQAQGTGSYANPVRPGQVVRGADGKWYRVLQGGGLQQVSGPNADTGDSAPPSDGSAGSSVLQGAPNDIYQQGQGA